MVAEVSLAKVNPNANPEQVCLLGCGVTTGLGAVKNTAKVQPGDTVAVFGLGGIGLADPGCHAGQWPGASSRLTPTPKFDLAAGVWRHRPRQPKDFDKPIQQVIVEMTGWGVDHSFECIGNVNVMRAALECTRTVAGASRW